MADTIPKVEISHRDVIVIGASAGGLEPLQLVLADLPIDLPAAVFVVLHLGATSYLAEILGRTAALPVRQARTGETIAPGHIYVAVPDQHLLLHANHLLLRRGPRENLSRPAVDPLFRSAAASFGPRVTGVVLSGALNDGTAGIRAIKQCGGVAVVQDPSDAAFPDMPVNALRYARIDHVVPASAIGELLGRLAREPPGPAHPVPFEIRLETAIAAQEVKGMAAEDELGRPSRFTCPECHGALWEIDDGSLLAIDAMSATPSRLKPCWRFKARKQRNCCGACCGPIRSERRSPGGWPNRNVLRTALSWQWNCRQGHAATMKTRR
jgi:two-component system chemotaxis response regulator CheB